MDLFGAALLKIAFDCCDAPRNPIWVSVAALALAPVAAGLIVQGMVLILGGEWLL
jgi:hypothetical protein